MTEVDGVDFSVVIVGGDASFLLGKWVNCTGVRFCIYR